MNPVIRLSKPGFNADTTGGTGLIWSSEYNAYKIAAQGSTTVSISNGNFYGTANVAHGQSVIPSTLAYFELSSGKRFLAGTPVLSGVTDYGGFAWTDSTNLNFFVNRATDVGAATVPVYYYILVDPAG